MGIFMLMHRIVLALGFGLLIALPKADAALYIADPAQFGAVQAFSSNCDDCFDGPIAFPGVGQTLNLFGTAYNGGFVGSNGYVTFGAGATSFTSAPLNTQTIGVMVAGLFTDLDSRDDATSQVFVNTATAGQLVVTFAGMGHFSRIYTVRSTFQLVIRSDQFNVPAGEGRIGFFYAGVTDTNLASAGFGDGLAAINPGEQAFFSGPANGLSNVAGRWFNVQGGVPIGPAPPSVMIPANSTLGLGLLALLLAFAGVWVVRSRAQG